MYALRICSRNRTVVAAGAAVAVGLGVLVWPESASACAACMNDDPQWQRKVPILMGFIGFPFLVFGVAVWATRRFATSSSTRSADRSSQE